MATDIQTTVKDAPGRADAKIITLVGSLDATNIQTVSQEIINLINSGVKYIIADFGQLKYLNSTALGNIIDYNKRAQSKGGEFILANVNDSVYEIFDIVGATSILHFVDTVDDGLAAI
jgi:anti-anti-sigma factor